MSNSKEKEKYIVERLNYMSDNKDENTETCTCKKNKCENTFCKGECGCKKCHDDYQDYLTEDYE